MPLCFVLMPFGIKPGPSGTLIDFDNVWYCLIEPAAPAAGLEPLRADEEQAGGVIYKTIFEHLVLCEYASADLSTANPNVLYELGVRDGIKPFSHTLFFASSAGQLPFDIGLLRELPCRLGSDGRPEHPEDDGKVLAQRLIDARQGMTDSPLFQLGEGFPDVQRLKTDVFREEVVYSKRAKEKLAEARKHDVQTVRTVEQELLDGGRRKLEDVDGGIAIDLMLSYHAVEGSEKMVDVVGRMSRPLAATILVREQLGFALNCAGRSDEAERVLKALIEQKGSSSETCGLLGRVYKDRWEKSLEQGSARLSAGWLRKAIDAYRQGFESDWRDAFPGINAVTLMEIADPPDPACAPCQGRHLCGRTTGRRRPAGLLRPRQPSRTGRAPPRRKGRNGGISGRAGERPGAVGTEDDPAQPASDRRGEGPPEPVASLDGGDGCRADARVRHAIKP